MSDLAPGTRAGAGTFATVSLKEFGGVLQAMNAVACSSLPLNLKALAHNMLLAGNSKTGVGFSGQATLGRRVGVEARHVRRLQKKLAQAYTDGLCPIHIHYRKRKHTSDVYTITVRADAPRSFSEAMSSGSAGPVEDDGSTGSLEPLADVSTGSVEHAEPAPQDPEPRLNRLPRTDNLRSGSTEPTTKREEESTQQGGAPAANAARAQQDESPRHCGVCMVGPGVDCKGVTHRRDTLDLSAEQYRALRNTRRMRAHRGQDLPADKKGVTRAQLVASRLAELAPKGRRAA
ncbi:MAG: hypothetical protein EOO73_34260 [Myxococcales bacterium]|nr:MAG: hypothetical protein EOO73_34260 [Myxococcales bacterium]